MRATKHTSDAQEPGPPSGLANTQQTPPSGPRQRLPHGSVLEVPNMPGKRLVEQMRRVPATVTGRCSVEIVLQRRPIVRMRAMVDDLLCPTSRRKSAEIGQ